MNINVYIIQELCKPGLKFKNNKKVDDHIEKITDINEITLIDIINGYKTLTIETYLLFYNMIDVYDKLGGKKIKECNVDNVKYLLERNAKLTMYNSLIYRKEESYEIVNIPLKIMRLLENQENFREFINNNKYELHFILLIV